MEINLTAMTPEMTRELNRIAERYRKPYTEFIDRLSELFADAKFWWDTPLASRNIHICRNFMDICILRLAMDIANQGQLTEWVVHNRGIQQALKDNLGARGIQVAAGVQLGLKAKIKEKILSSPWVAGEYAFYTFQRRIQKMQNWHGKKSMDAFRGRELTLVSTYRVPAEVKVGVLQDRYFPGLKENSDEDIVFLAHPVFGSKTEGKQLLDVLHASEDHICIDDWVEPNDFREVREYIQWCRTVSVPRCTFDGMDVTALVKEAFRIGAADNNTMYGIVKGRALCRLVEQYDLKIKCLIDWYEGQPSSNAMIRRFRAKCPKVPTVGCETWPLEGKWLSLFPSERQVENRVVPEYFGVMGRAWVNPFRQFCRDVKCIVAPSFRYQGIFDIASPDVTEKRKGILLLLSYFEDCTVELLKTLGKALQGLNGADIGPLYIKNHPTNQGWKLSDYGIPDDMFQGWNITYLTGDIYNALRGKAIVILCKSTSTLEIVLSGAYTVNFIPKGEISMVAIPEKVRDKVAVAYDAGDLRLAIKAGQEGLTSAEADKLREVSFVRCDRDTVGAFLALREI